MPLEEIDRPGRERCSRAARLARRLEAFNSAGSSVMLVEERDQHADAGDQAELGKPSIGGRQERQKARRGRQRRQRQRRAGAPAGMQQRLVQTVDLMPLGPIADAELESEIDSKADKQHGKINRDQVQRADHQQPSAAVIDSPTTRQTNTARMIRHQRNAIQRMNSTTRSSQAR